MTGWLRRAGRGRVPDGDLVAWSVAEGRRGRRWRVVRVAGDATIRSSLLFELDPDGRFSHTELAAPAGLLTLHPEGDGTIHGNTVTAAGVQPVAAPWAPEWGIAFEGDPFGTALGRWRGRGMIVAADLAWRVGAADVRALEIDGRGIPLLEDGQEWPLEE